MWLWPLTAYRLFCEPDQSQQAVGVEIRVSDPDPYWIRIRRIAEIHWQKQAVPVGELNNLRKKACQKYKFTQLV